MLLLLTIFLVLVGAVMLIIGFIQDSLVPIYISIGCSVAAAVVLVAFSRMSRRQGVRVVSLPREELTPEAPAPASDGLVSESITVLGPTAAEAEPVTEEVGPAHEAVLVGGPVSHDEGGEGAEADEEEAEVAPAAATTGLLARAEAGTADTLEPGAELATAGDEVAAGAGGLGEDAATEIPVAATDEAAAATGAGRPARAARGTTKSAAKKAAPRKGAARTTTAKAATAKKAATKAAPAKKAAARTTTAKAGTAKKAATRATPTKKAATTKATTTKAATAKAGTAKKAATKATPTKKAATRTTGGTGTRRRSGS